MLGDRPKVRQSRRSTYRHNNIRLLHADRYRNEKDRFEYRMRVRKLNWLEES